MRQIHTKIDSLLLFYLFVSVDCSIYDKYNYWCALFSHCKNSFHRCTYWWCWGCWWWLLCFPCSYCVCACFFPLLRCVDTIQCWKYSHLNECTARTQLNSVCVLINCKWSKNNKSKTNRMSKEFTDAVVSKHIHP